MEGFAAAFESVYSTRSRAAAQESAVASTRASEPPQDGFLGLGGQITNAAAFFLASQTTHTSLRQATWKAHPTLLSAIQALESLDTALFGTSRKNLVSALELAHSILIAICDPQQTDFSLVFLRPTVPGVDGRISDDDQRALKTQIEALIQAISPYLAILNGSDTTPRNQTDLALTREKIKNLLCSTSDRERINYYRELPLDPQGVLAKCLQFQNAQQGSLTTALHPIVVNAGNDLVNTLISRVTWLNRPSTENDIDLPLYQIDPNGKVIRNLPRLTKLCLDIQALWAKFLLQLAWLWSFVRRQH